MPKAKISVLLDVELLEWIDEQVRKGVFERLSQEIQRFILSLKSRLEGSG